ncbi:FtsX-like permease family protein [Trebonia sp.]|uniref:FtsX-like permease family protein n=1 Tax=Trebonia sp. TaxID=2767075 RepID=UPI00262E005D|nr:FtsX-like permease family protein [Trebonia sp.]
MVRLGLRLTLRSGREALVRLAITAAAVAVGVALLLGVLAEYHAFQANANQACWSCTGGDGAVPAPLPAGGELWNNSVDFYQGQTITRLDVAALASSAPVLPGIARLPGPEQYYASPALAALIRTVPADQLGDRFPGHLIGTIGDAALTGPNDLVIYIGYTPAGVAAIPGSDWVTSISTAPAPEVFTPFFRYAFGVGVLAVLFPMLVLIGTATRLAADRREERFAALRLVGGTPADIRVIAAVESVAGAFGGAVLGVVVFLLARPLLAGATLTGTQYFSSALTPTSWGYVAMLAGVPVIAAVAALLSLRRVQLSPLGVSRRATPKPPTAWRLTALVVGVALYVVGLLATTHQSIGGPAYPGLLITMAGLAIAGPWLTAQAARLFGSVTRGSSALLASRRLAGNPKAAFRSVTGLVLAVFLGTIVGTLVPAINATEASPANASLSNVLLDQVQSYAGPSGAVTLSARQSRKLVSGLNAIPGATTYPLYSLLVPGPPGPGGSGGPGGPGNDTAVSCAVMRALAVLGQCAPGVAAVQTTDDSLFSDNPLFNTKAFVSSSSQVYTGPLSSLPLQAVLVRVNSPATLERVRTFLAVNAPPQVFAGPGAAPTPPRTFGETLSIRLGRAAVVEKLVYAAVALTLVVAGCSLAVAVGGGLVDRKRPFTLLRAGGVPVGVLSRVVLLEAALPLAAATVLAAIIAYLTSVLAYVRLAPPGTAIPRLGYDYYALIVIGLVIAFGVIAVTLPLLRRMTAPGNVRFE